VQYALTRYCTLRITTSWDASVGLELRNVAKRVGAETYIHETSVRLAETGFSILLGPTLAGKTTLMQLMAGLDQPTSGEVWLGGRDMTARVYCRRQPSGDAQIFLDIADATDDRATCPAAPPSPCQCRRHPWYLARQRS